MIACPHGNQIPDTCVVCRRDGVIEIEIDDATIAQGTQPNPEAERTAPMELYPGARLLMESWYNKGKVEALGAMVDCLIEMDVPLSVAVEAAKCASVKANVHD